MAINIFSLKSVQMYRNIKLILNIVLTLLNYANISQLQDIKQSAFTY